MKHVAVDRHLKKINLPRIMRFIIYPWTVQRDILSRLKISKMAAQSHVQNNIYR